MHGARLRIDEVVHDHVDGPRAGLETLGGNFDLVLTLDRETDLGASMPVEVEDEIARRHGPRVLADPVPRDEVQADHEAVLRRLELRGRRGDRAAVFEFDPYDGDPLHGSIDCDGGIHRDRW